MNIALFSDQFYPELSGISDSVGMLGIELAKQGHSVVFVTSRYAKKDFEKAKLPFKEFDYNPHIPVIRIPSIVFPNSPTGQSRIALPLGPFGSAYSKLKAFKPDIIHTNSPFGVGLEALFISKLLKIPLIGTNHTPIAEFMAYSPFHPKWFVTIFVRYYSWYYNRCVFISAPCNALLDDMAKNGFNKSDIHKKIKSEAISNPVLLNSFTPPKNREGKNILKKRFGFSAHTVLYTGRLAEEKHVDDIIQAIKLVKNKIPDAMLVVTGHGTAEIPLKKLASELGIADSVRFLGYVDFSKFILVYQACDAFAVMSTAETQCISLMQAFSCGLPAVVAQAWGLPEYTDKEAGILVKPADVPALASNLILILNDSQLQQKMGVAGQEFVKKFSPTHVATQWLEIYKAHTKIYG